MNQLTTEISTNYNTLREASRRLNHYLETHDRTDVTVGAAYRTVFYLYVFLWADRFRLPAAQFEQQARHDIIVLIDRLQDVGRQFEEAARGGRVKDLVEQLRGGEDVFVRAIGDGSVNLYAFSWRPAALDDPGQYKQLIRNDFNNMECQLKKIFAMWAPEEQAARS